MKRTFRKLGLTLAIALLLIPSLALAAAFERPLSTGSTGPDVSALQTILRAKGFYLFPEITGYFGQVTMQAVASFQRSVGLDPLGYVGPATRAILNGEVVATSTPSVSGTSASLTTLITTLQQILRNRGFYLVELTGVLDQATLQAAKSITSGTSDAPRRSGGSRSRSSDNDEEAAADTTAPILTSVVGAPSLTSATVTWTSDEAATSQVEYGTTTSYGATTTLDSALVTSHSVPLTGLTASTTYHFRVLSADAAGNLATSSDQTFLTGMPLAAPSGVSVSGGNEQAVLTWTDPVHGDLALISIYRGTVSGNLTLLATTSPGTETYTDTGLVNGQTYYYALSATDTNAAETAQTSEQSVTLSSYLALARSLFQGTGRVAVWPDAANRGAGITGQIGSNRSAAEWGPLVGAPTFIVGREMSAQTWFGYEIPTGTVSEQYINHIAQSIFKPARFVRWDAGVAVADNGSGGAAPLPLDATASNRIRFRLNTLDTQVTDMSLAVVYMNANINKLATVTITGASTGTTTPNQIHTATQAVAAGWLASSALVSNGGTIADGAYVIETNFAGRQRLGNQGFVSVPLATNLPPDDYTVTVTVTTIGTRGESSGTSRAYIGGLFYRSAAVTEATSGASMARMGYVSSTSDGSADETFYLSGRPVAGGTNRESGKAHGNETQTEQAELLVDGVPYVMTGLTSTRARASNVATVKTQLPHGLLTGDIVTMSGFASTTYAAHEVTATVINSTTFTYPKTGVNESETADTAGRFIRRGIKVGSASVQLSQDSNLFHQDYLSGNTRIGGLTTTYTLSGPDKTFRTEAEGVLDIAYRHASSDAILATYWSGNPSTMGPVYPGPVTAKAYMPEQASLSLNADDGSARFSGSDPLVYAGKSLTFALSRPASDLAGIIEIVSTVGNDAFAGDWSTFIQDRSGGGVEKLYLMLRDDLGTKDTPAAWAFDYASDRIDGLAPGAKNSSIFVD